MRLELRTLRIDLSILMSMRSFLQAKGLLAFYFIMFNTFFIIDDESIFWSLSKMSGGPV